MSSSGSEPGMPGDNRGYQGIIDVHNRRHGVEWTLRQCTLTPESSGGRRFSCQATDEVHKKLGQFLIVDRAVHCEGRHAGLRVWRVVATPRQDGIHRKMHGLVRWDLARQACTDLRDVQIAWVDEIRPLLQVTRILGRLSI